MRLERFKTAIPAMKLLQTLGLDLMTTEIGKERKNKHYSKFQSR